MKDVEKYEKINIHELRFLAKEMGVNAPTLFKKADLINEILEIEEKKEKPLISNRGRPMAKRLGKVDAKEKCEKLKIQIEGLIEKLRKDILELLELE